MILSAHGQYNFYLPSWKNEITIIPPAPSISWSCEPEEPIPSKQIDGVDAVSLFWQTREVDILLQSGYHAVFIVTLRKLLIQPSHSQTLWCLNLFEGAEKAWYTPQRVCPAGEKLTFKSSKYRWSDNQIEKNKVCQLLFSLRLFWR